MPSSKLFRSFSYFLKDRFSLFGPEIKSDIDEHLSGIPR